MDFSQQIRNQTPVVIVPGYPPPAGYAPNPSNVLPSPLQPAPGFAPTSSNISGVVPSAPSMDKMDRIKGYETATFQGIPAAPPSYFETTMNSPPTVRPEISQLPNLTEEQVRESLANFVSQHCCYGKKPVQEMKIVSIEPACAYHYTIETYAEKRETAWVTEPYDGQFVDGPAYGFAPMPWDIQIYNTVSRYQDGQMFAPVPHTSSIKQCHKCVGLGRRPCENCMSMGRIQCSFCQAANVPLPQNQVTHHHHHHHHNNRNNTNRNNPNNNNRANYQQHTHHHHHHHHNNQHRNQNLNRQISNSNENASNCGQCNGSGWTMCHNCNGIGQKTCDACDGRGQLKCYIKLTVTMKNHLGDYLVDSSNRSFLPQNLLKSSTGTLIYEEDAPKIWPITGFPIAPVVDASRLLIQQHCSAFQNERIHCQRQRVRTIPVSEIICIYKGEEAKFYVYGLQNEVYFPDYFVQCCGCCSIM